MSSLLLPQSRRCFFIAPPFTGKAATAAASRFCCFVYNRSGSAPRIARMLPLSSSSSSSLLLPLFSTKALNESDSPVVVDSHAQSSIAVETTTTPSTTTTTTTTTTLPPDIVEANERYAGRIAIRPAAVGSKGWGLFALQSFAPHDFVMRGTALRFDSVPDSHSVQVDWTVHAQMDAPARYINHCCGHANVGIRPNDVGAYDFVALQHIATHDELLWDYETSEYELGHPFDCQCGTDQCRGTLLGFRYHATLVVQAYGTDSIAPFLLTPRTRPRPTMDQEQDDK